MITRRTLAKQSDITRGYQTILSLYGWKQTVCGVLTVLGLGIKC